jgi:hypothetical protein
MIVRAFCAARESADGAISIWVEECACTASQYLVGVTLVGNIENDAVFRRAKDVVQGDRQFDGTEIRTEMAAVCGAEPYDRLSDFLGQNRQLREVERFEIIRVINSFEQIRHRPPSIAIRGLTYVASPGQVIRSDAAYFK